MREFKLKSPVIPEKDVVHDCLGFLNRQPGVYAWRNNTGAHVFFHKGKRRFIRYGAVGSADILGVMGSAGRFLAVECKRVGEDASDEQFAWLGQVQDRGGIACVVHSLDELVEFWAQVRAL